MKGKNIVEEIKRSVKIEDVVGKYLNLKKVGKNYVALCPFHPESNPSFTVSPELQIYKCFGCGATGDVIKFIMEYKRITFREAVKELAEIAGIDLKEYWGKSEEELKEEDKERYRILRINSIASNMFQKFLFSEEGKYALEYLYSRGLDNNLIKVFQIGFAPANFSKKLLEMKIKEEELVKAGILIKRSGYTVEYKEIFSDRVVFPIISEKGEVVGFGGRIISEASDEPKYINTPETLLFKKRENLYGIFQAKLPMKEKDRAIVVEGYMDVLMMHKVGLKETVAPLGTALTEEQLQILQKYSKKLFLFFDNDDAGRKATDRTIDLIFQKGLEIIPTVILIPHVKDAGELFAKNIYEDPWGYLYKYSLDPFEFKMIYYESLMDIKDPIMREKYIHVLANFLKKIKDPVFVQQSIKKLADKLSVSPQILEKIILQESYTPTYKSIHRNFFGNINVSAEILEEQSIEEQEIILFAILSIYPVLFIEEVMSQGFYPSQFHIEELKEILNEFMEEHITYDKRDFPLLEKISDEKLRGKVEKYYEEYKRYSYKDLKSIVKELVIFLKMREKRKELKEKIKMIEKVEDSGIAKELLEDIEVLSRCINDLYHALELESSSRF